MIPLIGLYNEFSQMTACQASMMAEDYMNAAHFSAFNLTDLFTGKGA
jgi:hypothetical protein